jgi:hypothetical protein
MKLAQRFGNVRQEGYIVRDVHAAVRHWTEALGVGPFFMMPGVKVPVTYKGASVVAELDVAFSHHGDFQIEITQQTNDVPTIWSDFIRGGGEGFHHCAFWTEDFDRDLAAARELGMEPVQTALNHSSMCYFEPMPGFVFELSEHKPGSAALRERIAAASRAWDGSDPVRPMTLVV